MPLRAVLFDFDGLILDTETPEVEAYTEIYAEFDLSFPDSVWKSMIGVSGPDTYSIPWVELERLLGRPVDKEALRIRAREMRVALIEKKPPQPGVVQLLDQCSRLGIRVAVVSSSAREWVEGHLSRLGLLSRFEFCVCGHEGLPSKPAPDLYLEGIRRLSEGGSDIVAIEDSPNGIRSARDAGLRVLCVPNALTVQMDLSQATARYESLADVNLGRW